MNLLILSSLLLGSLLVVLSAQSSLITGQRSIKSVHGTYLRSWNPGQWKVDLAPICLMCEHWFIEDHDGKVICFLKL